MAKIRIVLALDEGEEHAAFEVTHPDGSKSTIDETQGNGFIEVNAGETLTVTGQ